MSITFSCVACKSKMTVPDTMAGKRGKCSKCKGPIQVPTPQNGHAAKAAAQQPPVDLEAEAAALLSDAPKEEKKAEFIEFNCPQCDEPIKMGLDLAGKRAPCPECRRIIPVPMPKAGTTSDWRNTGPKLPTGAKRDDGPAPEGAWGTGTVARASHEALQEAGVIKEKEKPLTFYQRYQRVMLIGGPLILLVAGGLFVWNWMTRVTEDSAYRAALATAAAPNSASVLGGGGLAGLYGFAGEYQLRRNKEGCGKEAHEHFASAANLGKSTQSPETDALLIDLAVMTLGLSGQRDEIDTGRKLSWKEVNRVLMATLRGIDGREAQMAAVRKLTGALVERNQADQVLSVLNNLFGGSGSDRSEALATAALELYRLGNKEEAEKALPDVLAPYNDKKAKPPELTAAVVCLAVLLGKDAPKPGKSQYDREAEAVGTAEAQARLGKLDDARGKIKGLPRQDGGELRGLIAVAVADPKSSDDLDKALTAAAAASKRKDLDWPLLRLIETGIVTGVAADKLEPVAAAIEDAGLAAWGQYLLVRGKLAKSRSVEAVGLVEKISPKTVGGLMARLELARHNTLMSQGWASTVKTWEDGPRAVGSLGVALGLQGGK